MESRTQVNISCSLFNVVYQKQKPYYIINQPRAITPVREKTKSKVTLSKSYSSNSLVCQKQGVKNVVNKSVLDTTSKCSIMDKNDQKDEQLRRVILKKTRVRTDNKKVPSFLARKSKQIDMTKNTDFSTTFEKTLPFANNRQSENFEKKQLSRIEESKYSFKQINCMKRFASENMDEISTPKMQGTWGKGENTKTLKQLTYRNVTSSGGITSEQHISVISSLGSVREKGITGFFHRHSASRFQLNKLGFTQ